jgi:spermidine synthase
MTASFEILDQQETPLGELVLRRRHVPALGGETVWEVLLDGAFLMSSLVNESEVALAERTLARVEGEALDVLVGGLGLGCTAEAALRHRRVRSLVVVERLGEVIRWHREGLVPLGRTLTTDPRVTLLEADFFEHVAALDAAEDPRRHDAIIVDIDHSPRHPLNPGHAAFYEEAGLGGLARRLAPRGVFALWSAEPFEDAFLQRLGRALGDVEVEPVGFLNPLASVEEVNWLCFGRQR